MNADAIRQATQAMADRLRQALTSSGRDPDKLFVGPPDDPDAGEAPLILFLYRLVPSATLRNHEHRVTVQGPAASDLVVFQNSLPLDLYYLVTVGVWRGMQQQAMLDQLSTLGHAIRGFHLDPELTGATTGHEAVRVSFEPLTTDEASRIWQLFPAANYRTSVSYLATPVWIDPPPPPPSRRVVEDALMSGQKRRAEEQEHV